MNQIILLEFAAYFILITTLAWWTSRQRVTHEVFLLGGDRLPGWALAFSERATGESAWLLLGFTGFVFVTGLAAIWVALGIATGIVFAWLVLAQRFRREAHRLGVLTLPDYLAVRLGQRANVIRWLATLLIASFFMFYVGAQFAGAGKVFFTIFDIDARTGILIAVAVVIATSLFGGFLSVVWTDMVQSLMMLLTLVLLPIIAFAHIGTRDLSVARALVEAGSGFDHWFGGLTGFAVGVMLFNNFSWFFGYLGGQPQLSARFMALRNAAEGRQGIAVAIIWTLLAYGGAFAIGLAAIAMYPQGSLPDPETVLPRMILELTPPWFAGLLLSGILAAIITTANSQLMVVTSSVTEDILHKALGLQLTDRSLVRISRGVIIAGGLIGMVIALTSESLVYLVVGWAWAGVGGTLSPAILLSFFWKRYSSLGLIATILAGFIFTVIWIGTPLDAVLTSRFATFWVASLAGVAVSLLCPDRIAPEAPAH